MIFDSMTAALAKVECHESDNTALPVLKTKDNCGLRELANGLYQWRYDKGIKCEDPVTGTSHVGANKCTWIIKDSKYGYRKAWIGAD